MTREEVLVELEQMADPQIKKIYQNHGAVEPFFGVKIGEMKTLVKKIKKNHQLSLDLFATGNSDAMYLAGLIADEKKISKEELRQWAKQATWHQVSNYTVAWVAAESPYGWELGLEWIESPDELVAAAGWSTLSSVLSITPDEKLDGDKIYELLEHVGENIHNAPNWVRYNMNGFVISVGGYYAPLLDKALEVGKKIGKVDVYMGNNACKVPMAAEYIQQMVGKGYLGKKKKMARC